MVNKDLHILLWMQSTKPPLLDRARTCIFAALVLGMTNDQLGTWEFLIKLGTALQNSGQLATPDRIGRIKVPTF